MAQLLHEHIEQNGVALSLGDGVSSFEDRDGAVTVTLNSGKQVRAELVILSIGLRSNTELAKAAGLEMDDRGGLIVNDHMNIIGCLDVPSSGKYLLDGHDVGQLNKNQLAEIRNRMLGFIFQQYNLLPKLSLLENVEIPLMYAGVPKSERRKKALAVLDRVGLADKLANKPSQLSGGQQQRVSIARALAGDPAVILADEPTGALDSHTGREVLAMLQKVHAAGNTVVLITHVPGDRRERSVLPQQR